MKPYQTEEAKNYNVTRSSWPEVLDCFLRYINSPNFLDAGCGTGNDLLAIYERTGFAGFACDYSLDMLQEAKAKVPDATFAQVNLDSEFPFDQDFDVIYNHDVLQHLKTPEVFIRNAYDHLMPKAHIIIANEFQEGLPEKFTSQYFPGALALDRLRYHKKAAIIAQMEALDFTLVDTVEIHDTEPFTKQILAQTRTRSHSILRLLPYTDFVAGLKKLEADVESGVLVEIARNYTMLVGRK